MTERAEKTLKWDAGKGEKPTTYRGSVIIKQGRKYEATLAPISQEQAEQEEDI